LEKTSKSTFLTRRLLARFPAKRVLLAGLTAMAVGQLTLAQISASSGYVTGVLPGLVLTALGIGLALPTASIAITTGVERQDQGLAGALFTTSQRTGAAIGLAILATVAATRTRASGSLTVGYQLSFLVATAMAVVAVVAVAVAVSPRDPQDKVLRRN
jgi:MFS family permease